jgi:signal transduction histidine kinase/CheY-like chemotaxis protein
MCVVGLLAAIVFAQTTLFQRLNVWLQDSQSRTFAKPIDLGGVVVFDIDEESVRRLAPVLGPWPYDYDAFAMTARYLASRGARAVAFDVLFSDDRPGISLMQSALAPNVALAGFGIPVTLPQTPAYKAQLERLALARQPLEGGPEALARAGWRQSALPDQPWASLKLPVEALTPVPGPRIGILNIMPDDDGIVRRLPLFHSTQGYVFPSFALASLLAADPALGELRLDGPRLQLRRLTVPLTRDGHALLRFPSNIDDVRVIPFHELFAFAEGTAKGPDWLAREVAGKTVFIGSTTGMGDFVYTPAGRMTGLQFDAVSHAALASGYVMTPSSMWIDVALVLATLAVPFGLALRGGDPSGRHFFAAFMCIALALAVAGTALASYGIHAQALFAFIAGSGALALAFTAWLFRVSDERRRLRYETMAARETTRLKGEFLNHLAHELRTPLTAVMGFNKLNQFTDDLGRDARIKNSAIIGRNCEYLLQVINNQLDLAKLESGALAIARAPEDPDQLCRDAVERMQPFADEKRIRLKYVRGTPLPATLALDAFRVRQILINLLGNALKFTQAGSVELVASWHLAALVLEVRDTGPGIPPEALGRIFRAFEQADDTIAQRFGGTGLGLAITRQLVELMGGRIEVESRVGLGSTFRVRIPTEAAEGRPASQPIGDAQAMREPLAGRVLVAEDNEDIRVLVQIQLSKLGVDATTVANGFSAVERALSDRYDVVLMDMEMPLMNGYEAVNVLRTRGYTGTILALTAHHEGLEVERAVNAGCDGIVTKPVTIESLRTALRPLLRHGNKTPKLVPLTRTPKRTDAA